MTSPRLLPLFGLAALGPVLACGDGPDPAPKVPPPAETKVDAKAPVAAGSTGSGTGPAGTTVIDPFATDGWAEDDDFGDTEGADPTGTGGTGGAEVAPERHPGPCTVRWNKGPILRFRYADDGGGRLRIDGDNDGKSDVCARFWTKDSRTNKVTVDQGCDKSTDAIITPRYDDKANLATATWTDQRSEAKPKHEITLVTLPAFSGVVPGYPLYAPRDEVKLKITKELVTRATVDKPVEGPPVKVSFTYDDDGRVKRINEDHEADGKVDRRYDYRYDEVGNVTGITLTETDYTDGGKGKRSKKTARLSYRCWAKKAAE